MADILPKHFPTGYSPRSFQSDVLDKVNKAFKHKKIVILSAPTGVGKSFIAKAVANSTTQPCSEFRRLINSYEAFKYEGGEYVNSDVCLDYGFQGSIILTITKSLQDQYTEQFTDIKDARGKNNYVCSYMPFVNCDFAPCEVNVKLKRDCQMKHSCLYYNAKNEALMGKISTMNYPMYCNIPSHVKQKEILICDEASELESQLVNQFTCSLNINLLEKYGVSLVNFDSLNYQAQSNKLSEVVTTLVDIIDELTCSIDKGSDIVKKRRLQTISLLKNLSNTITSMIDTWDECEYVVEFVEDYSTGSKVTKYVIKPLYVHPLAGDMFKDAEKVLLMSATIIDPANYAKTLGIDKSDYEFIEVESPFDAKKSPINMGTGILLNFKNIDYMLPSAIDMVNVLCGGHSNDKGIIHTHSNKITMALYDRFKDDGRFLFRMGDTTNEDILKIHMESSDPTILVSPSMTYGVDLKGDLAKFQILLKAPWLGLGDSRVKKKLNVDPDWYTDCMLNDLVQACGRGVRSESCECVTYIIDDGIKNAVERSWYKMPKYFKDRVV